MSLQDDDDDDGDEKLFNASMVCFGGGAVSAPGVECSVMRCAGANGLSRLESDSPSVSRRVITEVVCHIYLV